MLTHIKKKNTGPSKSSPERLFKCTLYWCSGELHPLLKADYWGRWEEQYSRLLCPHKLKTLRSLIFFHFQISRHAGSGPFWSPFPLPPLKYTKSGGYSFISVSFNNLHRCISKANGGEKILELPIIERLSNPTQAESRKQHNLSPGKFQLHLN